MINIIVCNCTTMSDFEKQTLEMEIQRFAASHFEKPARCNTLEQIRSYVSELCRKIQEYEARFNYVPATAYLLLAQYNARQNSMLYQDFIKTY